MQAQTSKNTWNERENPVLDKIAAILQKTHIKWLIFESEEIGAQITQILKEIPEAIENKELGLFLIEKFGGWYYMELHPKLREDTDIMERVLQKEPNMFSKIPLKKLLSERNIQALLQWYIAKRTSFVEVEKFLWNNFKDSKKFFTYLNTWKQMRDNLPYSQIEKLLIEIRETNDDSYKLLFEKELLSVNGKNISLHQKVLKYILKTLWETEDFSTLSEVQKQEFILSLLSEHLGKNLQDLDENTQKLLGELGKNIQYKDTKTDAHDDEKDPIQIQEGSDEESDTGDEIQDIPILSSYNYSFSSSYCTIDTGNIKVDISKSELDSFSDRALQNYLYARELFESIGLGFIFRHKEQFFWTICGIDYLHEPGLSEWVILKVCNTLGKKLGIPQKTFQSWGSEMEDSSPQDTWCFHTLSEARYRYREIASSGKINDRKYDISKKWSRSIVEIDLIRNWYFDEEGRGFRVARFLWNDTKGEDTVDTTLLAA